jgi:hypothetical protein
VINLLRLIIMASSYDRLTFALFIALSITTSWSLESSSNRSQILDNLFRPFDRNDGDKNVIFLASGDSSLSDSISDYNIKSRGGNILRHWEYSASYHYSTNSHELNDPFDSSNNHIKRRRKRGKSAYYHEFRGKRGGKGFGKRGGKRGSWEQGRWSKGKKGKKKRGKKNVREWSKYSKWMRGKKGENYWTGKGAANPSVPITTIPSTSNAPLNQAPVLKPASKVPISIAPLLDTSTESPSEITMPTMKPVPIASPLEAPNIPSTPVAAPISMPPESTNPVVDRSSTTSPSSSLSQPSLSSLPVAEIPTTNNPSTLTLSPSDSEINNVPTNDPTYDPTTDPTISPTFSPTASPSGSL